MSKKNVEVINDTNYSITDRSHPVKKKRHIFGTIVAILISLLIALFMRYYVEMSGDLKKQETEQNGTNAALQIQEQEKL